MSASADVVGPLKRKNFKDGTKFPLMSASADIVHHLHKFCYVLREMGYVFFLKPKIHLFTHGLEFHDSVKKSLLQEPESLNSVYCFESLKGVMHWTPNRVVSYPFTNLPGEDPNLIINTFKTSDTDSTFFLRSKAIFHYSLIIIWPWFLMCWWTVSSQVQNARA